MIAHFLPRSLAADPPVVPPGLLFRDDRDDYLTRRIFRPLRRALARGFNRTKRR